MLTSERLHDEIYTRARVQGVSGATLSHARALAELKLFRLQLCSFTALRIKRERGGGDNGAAGELKGED